MYRFIDNNESTVKRYYIRYLLIARFSFVSITLTTLEIDGTEGRTFVKLSIIVLVIKKRCASRFYIYVVRCLYHFRQTGFTVNSTPLPLLKGSKVDRISLTTCLRWIVTLPLPVVDAMPTCSGTPSPGPPLTPPTFTLHQVGQFGG